MAQIAITVNKRSYRFECDDSDVERLEKLSGYLNEKLDGIIAEHGAVGDERLVVMAAILLADELFDARADIDNLLDGQTERLKSVSIAMDDAESQQTSELDTVRTRRKRKSGA
ncbi:MAG: cell division protein ZapA [Hyphomicrobium sp.]|nr:MAG: cell division protein ZapA [Hyphomicrobium sp.]PPD01972.1 MAG: cell division protein ZapA [Hyphomicrobium sp.]